MPVNLKGSSLLTLKDFTPEEVRYLLDLAHDLKSKKRAGMMLYPRLGRLRLMYDNDYIMASLGVLSKKYPQEALALMKGSIGI